MTYNRHKWIFAHLWQNFKLFKFHLITMQYSAGKTWVHHCCKPCIPPNGNGAPCWLKLLRNGLRKARTHGVDLASKLPSYQLKRICQQCLDTRYHKMNREDVSWCLDVLEQSLIQDWAAIDQTCSGTTHECVNKVDFVQNAFYSLGWPCTSIQCPSPISWNSSKKSEMRQVIG